MERSSVEQHRVEANGIDFAYLSAGPEDGPLVLCLHGFPDDAHTFSRLLPVLAEAGFRAVAPWMRGYHPTSPAPDGRYQSAVLALDALALVRALSPDAPAAIVGHDWGAMAACGAAILDPACVRAAVSMALPHPAVVGGMLAGDWEQRKRSWYMWFFQVPGLPELIVANDHHAFLDRLWSEWSPGWTPDPEHLAGVKRSLSAPGALEAALAYYRQTIDLTAQADDLAAVQADASSGVITVPALFLAGARDGCFAPDFRRESLGFCSGPAALEVLDNCGHFLHLEEPERVNTLVLEFLLDGLPARALDGRAAQPEEVRP